MHFSLRKFLLVVFLGFATLVASTSYVQASADPCDCCPLEVHDLMCSSCKVCTSPALLSLPLMLSFAFEHSIQSTIRPLRPSMHIEDIWHPPKHLLS